MAQLQEPFDTDQNDCVWYSISGWNGPRPSMLRAESRADLAFSRRIIREELRQFEARLPDLNKRLDPSSKAYGIVLNSMNPQRFDLRAETPVCRPSGNSVPRFTSGELVFDNPIELAHVGAPALDWLGSRFPSGGHMLQIGADDDGFGAHAAKARFIVHAVTAGEGEVRASPSLLPDRYRAADGAFASWFATAASAMRASIGIFRLGRGAQTLDVELLRWRLAPHHVVVVEKDSVALNALRHRWDGNAYELSDRVVFADPGPRFLAPEHGGGSHLPDERWPKISVVTVSYNQGQFLTDCLESVLGQDYPNLEYIVIDAVSTDGSIEILRRYESRLSRLVIEKDRGQSDGLNKGLGFASGDLLTWVNSDDMLAPGALHRVALSFMQYNCDVVSGGCERISERSSDVFGLHHSALPYLRKVPLGFPENLVWHQSWEKGDYFFQPEVVFTAEIWRRSGGFLKEHLYWAMDWDLWIRMAMAGATIVHVPDTVGRSRTHPDQKTTGDELYLYQLKNILLEFDDALVAVEHVAATLKPGEYRVWPITPAADEAPRLSILGRTRRLINTEKFRITLRNRLSPGQIERLRRIRSVLRRDGFRAVLSRSLPRARRARIEQLNQASLEESQRLRARTAELEVENVSLQRHAKAVSEAQRNFAQALLNQAKSLREEYEISREAMERAHEISLKAMEQAHAEALKRMEEEFTRSLELVRAEYSISSRARTGSSTPG